VSRLDLEAVVDTALGIADDRGLDAVSLRRIAERLGVTPMALYRYVQGKDDLLDALAERLYAELDLPDGSGGWWDGLQRLAHSTRRVLLAHPWAAPLFARPLAGRHARALDDALQRELRRAGFTPSEARELHDQLSNMVFALVAPELHGKRNRAAFDRGLELLHAGLEARRRRRRSRPSAERASGGGLGEPGGSPSGFQALAV
jgi:AcrR family transcriptional regulator